MDYMLHTVLLFDSANLIHLSIAPNETIRIHIQAAAEWKCL